MKNYLTNAERLSFTLTPELTSITVGLVLGDLYIRMQKLGKNPCLVFEQGLVHQEYLNHLYELFQSYSRSAPKVSNRLPHKITGKVYTRITFLTHSLPCFVPLYELFYVDGKKVIPLNIGELLTPLGLCYWICDDGSWDKNKKFVVLATNSYTFDEVNLLVSVLNSKWDLKCYKAKQGNAYRIIIPSYSISSLQTLLAPHMPSMMRFKIGL